MLNQHEEKSEIFVIELKNSKKEKQSKNRAKTIANPYNSKMLDFSHHFVTIEMFEKNRSISLKIEDIREFRKIIKNTIEEEK